MKYRQLTKEQFESLHEEFARFLASQSIDEKEWKQLKKEKPNVATDEMNVFSDVVWDDVLTKTNYLEHFSKQTVNLFKCEKDSIERIVIKTDKEINFLEQEGYEWLLKNPLKLFYYFWKKHSIIMKKIIILFCAVLLSSFSVKTSKEQVKTFLTSGKWFVESVQENGQEPEMVEDKNDEWIIFHEEGKLEENLYGEITNSTWEYSQEKNSIKIIGDDIDVTYKKIIEITENKLTVELTEGDNDSLIVNYTK